jgi:hypothetical protein
MNFWKSLLASELLLGFLALGSEPVQSGADGTAIQTRHEALSCDRSKCMTALARIEIESAGQLPSRHRLSHVSDDPLTQRTSVSADKNDLNCHCNSVGFYLLLIQLMCVYGSRMRGVIANEVCASIQFKAFQEAFTDVHMDDDEHTPRKCEQCRRRLDLGVNVYSAEEGVIGPRGFVSLEQPNLFCGESCLRDCFDDVDVLRLKRRIP